jgi:hypothetical protein
VATKPTKQQKEILDAINVTASEIAKVRNTISKTPIQFRNDSNPNWVNNQATLAALTANLKVLQDKLNASYLPQPPDRPSGIVAQTVVRAGIIVEANPPTSDNTPVSGQPSTPTTENYCKAIDYTNARRSHVCDFILEMKKDINLSKYTQAIANTIREAVRKLLALLGGTDSSGVTTFLINTLKNIARELRDFNKYVLKPITDFANYVISYIATLRSIIAWILSLPAKLAQLLSDCLVRLRQLITSVFTSIITSAAAVGSGADPNAIDAGLTGSDSAGFADVIAEARNATAAVTETLTATQETATAVAGVGISAIALFSPLTAEEANSASSQALDAMLIQNISSTANSALVESDTRKNSNPYETANEFSPELV